VRSAGLPDTSAEKFLAVAAAYYDADSERCLTDTARTVEAVNETTLTAPPAQAESGDEPPAHPALAKYGGDVNKALDALEHSQREIGRLGNEVGEKRALERELAELRAELEFWRAQYPLTAATIVGRLRKLTTRTEEVDA
jgi:hypothetical protein